MHYDKIFVQYNDLVFGRAIDVTADDTDFSVKDFTEEYSFTHGSYAPYKRRGSLYKTARVSLTLIFNVKKLPCSARPFYRRHAIEQLDRPGKLWAVQDNTLMWAYAFLSGGSDIAEAKRDTFEMDVDFTLPEGIWHKADKQKTFLMPYDVCEFMDCYDYREVSPCQNCCFCEQKFQSYCRCCECDTITKDMALCYHTKELQDYYSCDGAPFRIVYSCEMAHKYFMESFYGVDHLWTKMCTDDGIIAGMLYSDTDLPTGNIDIMLHGHVKDPYITINGNSNQIRGEYDGVLMIHPDGTVEYQAEGCIDAITLDVEKWVIPEHMNYGWEIHQGNNKVVMELGDCCQTACAYIQTDSITR